MIAAIVTVLLVGLATAQPALTGKFTKAADGSSSGTVVISGLTFSPCKSTSFTFPESIPNSLADNNDNVLLSLSYTYTAKSSKEVLIMNGVPMALTLAMGDKSSSPTNVVSFTPTSGTASTITVSINRASKFDTLVIDRNSVVNGVERCDPAMIDAPGVEGWASVTLQLKITIGSGGGALPEAPSDGSLGVVVAYKNGKLKDGFQDFPWGKRTYSYEEEFIDWTPCEYIGLTFYNTAKKYLISSVRGIRLSLKSAADMTVQLRLHNVGKDRDIFTTLVQLTATEEFQTVTVPIVGVAATAKFDQILIAENQGAKCASKPPHVFVEEVAIVGLADLPTQYLISINGVEQDTDNEDGSGTKTGAKKNSAAGLVVDATIGLVVVLLLVVVLG